MKLPYRLIIPVGLLALPSVAMAQAATTFQSLANSVAKILNDGALLLISAALAVYFYNIVNGLIKLKEGHADGSDLKKTLWVGLGIIFVMVSIWGIIQVLQNSLFGGPGPAASNGVINYTQ
jgi:hypothetical protein